MPQYLFVKNSKASWIPTIASATKFPTKEEAESWLKKVSDATRIDRTIEGPKEWVVVKDR